MFHSSTDRTIAGIITPRLNWTTLVTDELLAAVTAEAINLADPNQEDGVSRLIVEAHVLCRWSYIWRVGCGGRCYQDRAINPQKGVRPLSKMFSASVHPDLGIEAPHLEFGEYEKLDDSTNGSWTVTASQLLTNRQRC